MADVRPAPFFIGDDLALDFLNSVAGLPGARIEWLANGGDLLNWLEVAGAVPTDVAAQFRADTVLHELDGVADQARRLREWFRGFVCNHAGRALDTAALRDLTPINRLLERDEAYRQIGTKSADMGGVALQWLDRRRWRTRESLLLPIAGAMGDLVCGKDFALVRPCEGQACTLWFYDTSKNHGRRWCSMAICGNRAKANSHRARARQRLVCE
jgi:predicted RNA-binding Zn ribbon-like protein